ncbi:hypothetical protein [Neomoorella thermoacetica]|uniref:hypothetical protein n=1 Tax=Neomoorella thermoacetica TaxID=1525 RepID=UPI0008FA0D74|nr:hypothetical protein [Moorella thermoacetica]OIQ11535.1 hypothetical protein MOOTH_15210 [Moorella thermoacetica]OIQ59954.1 hypothetical protein MTIN_21260 [Moorella thermoacetica]
MTASELFANFGISILSGLATGAFFAQRTPPNTPSIDIFISQPSFTIKQTISRRTYYTQAKNEINIGPFEFIILSILGVGIINVLFARFYVEILKVGWLLIAFFSATVISFIALNYWSAKKLSKLEVWCLICLLGISCNFWLFSRTLNDPTYINYLQAVSQSGIKSVKYGRQGYFPVYQLSGLFLLLMIIAITFLQSIGILLWPIAFNNNAIFTVFNKCKFLLNKRVIIIQAFFLVLAWLLVTGRLISLIMR